MTDPDLEQLIKITRILAICSTHDVFYERYVEEEKSLKSKLEEKLEKAEKYDMFEREDPDATIPIIENVELRKENQKLKEENIEYLTIISKHDSIEKTLSDEVKQLREENESLKNVYGVLQNKFLEIFKERDTLKELADFNADNLKKSLDEVIKLQQDKETLKEKLDRIKTCPFMIRCLECGMSGVPKTRDDKECGNCNSMRTEIVIRESEILKELES